MSEGYLQVPLSELAHLRMGGTPSRAEPHYWAEEQSGHPWASIADLNNKFIRATNETITDSGVQAAHLRFVPAGTPIMSFKLTIGRIAIPQRPIFTNEAIVALAPQEGRSVARWLYHAVPRIASRQATATAVKGQTLNLPKLRSLLVPTPTIAEQQRIAEILDVLDEQIVTAQRVLTKNSQVTSALAAKVWNESSSWTRLSLEEIASIAAGLTLGSEPNGPNSVELPYLRVANVQDGFIDTSEMKTVRVLRSEIARYAVQAGDVLLTEGGDFDKLGRGAVWDGSISPCLHQNHIFRVRCQKDRAIPGFLAAYMSSPAGRNYFLNIAKQTTNLASINSTQLKAMPVPVPPVEAQIRLLAPAQAAQSETAYEEAELNKLRFLKAGLMDDLLSGRVRVTRSGELTG